MPFQNIPPGGLPTLTNDPWWKEQDIFKGSGTRNENLWNRMLSSRQTATPSTVTNRNPILGGGTPPWYTQTGPTPFATPPQGGPQTDPRYAQMGGYKWWETHPPATQPGAQGSTQMPIGNTGAATTPTNGNAQNPIEQFARQRIDSAMGQGHYDRFQQRTGKSILDKYQENPKHLYWDEPNTPEGAINSYLRDEKANARNAAVWKELHGDVKIPQEIWERWYYANRQGLGPTDMNYDGNRVVY